MKFGPVPTEEAEGAILAHSQPLASGKLPKGQRLEAEDIARLLDEGIASVIACRLEPGISPRTRLPNACPQRSTSKASVEARPRRDA